VLVRSKKGFTVIRVDIYGVAFLSLCLFPEFIHLIASEANEVCEKQSKKTISPEHVLEALKVLGFDAYIEEVEVEYREHQAQTRGKERTKGATKLEASGLSEEELLRQQEELFERARLRMASTLGTASTASDVIDENAAMAQTSSQEP
jgi:hypothetical protein